MFNRYSLCARENYNAGVQTGENDSYVKSIERRESVLFSCFITSVLTVRTNTIFKVLSTSWASVLPIPPYFLSNNVGMKSKFSKSVPPRRPNPNRRLRKGEENKNKHGKKVDMCTRTRITLYQLLYNPPPEQQPPAQETCTSVVLTMRLFPLSSLSISWIGKIFSSLSPSPSVKLCSSFPIGLLGMRSS